MNIDDAMTQLGTQLDTITGLRVFPYPPDSLNPPAAIVAWPDRIVYDGTYRRGMDRLTVPVVVLVARTSDRASRKELAAYMDGAGTKSIKAVLEAGTYTAFHTLRVMEGEFDIIRVGATDYAAITFDVDIAGSGS